MQSKINETKDLMKKKAQEIEKTKIEAAKGAGRMGGISSMQGALGPPQSVHSVQSALCASTPCGLLSCRRRTPLPGCVCAVLCLPQSRLRSPIMLVPAQPS